MRLGWSRLRKGTRRNAEGLPIRVFSGIECDILRDGAMDFANDALAELDMGDRQRAQSHESGAGGDDRRLARALECRLCGCWAISPGAFCCIGRATSSISRGRGESGGRGVWLEIMRVPSGWTFTDRCSGRRRRRAASL